MLTSASSPTDRAVPGDGVRLHARDWGGSGQPLVLLHGLASNARIWDGVAPRLTGAGPTREEARRRMAPPRFAVPLSDWLGRAGRFEAGGPGQPWIRDYLRPVLLCVAADPADGQAQAEAKRGAAARALDLLPSATVTWFEDTMHDIPLQRPADLAAELARFADSLKEVPANG